MFLVTSNPAKQLLVMRYCDRVTAKHLKASRSDLKALLAELTAGFNVLADFSQLESMAADCVPEVGAGMELVDAAKPGMLVRVIPDPSKDIGLNILTAFHYKQRPRIVTCATLSEAARTLEL
ncbi:MAG: hypothetical protein QM813_11705 [Verrucomicrobiota bacterium]